MVSPLLAWRRDAINVDFVEQFAEQLRGLGFISTQCGGQFSDLFGDPQFVGQIDFRRELAFGVFDLSSELADLMVQFGESI